VTTKTALPDGSIKIESTSYYEKPSSYIEEIEKPMQTSLYTYKEDINHALQHIEDGAIRLQLTIETKNGKPSRLIKRYTTVKQSYPRR